MIKNHRQLYGDCYWDSDGWEKEWATHENEDINRNSCSVQYAETRDGMRLLHRARLVPVVFWWMFGDIVLIWGFAVSFQLSSWRRLCNMMKWESELREPIVRWERADDCDWWCTFASSGLLSVDTATSASDLGSLIAVSPEKHVYALPRLSESREYVDVGRFSRFLRCILLCPLSMSNVRCPAHLRFCLLRKTYAPLREATRQAGKRDNVKRWMISGGIKHTENHNNHDL